MKKATLVTLSLLAQFTLISMMIAQANPRGKATLESGGVSIDYGRPSARGRDLVGLISAGTYWRMGADDATTLTTKSDLVFAGKVVPKGTYVLAAHVKADGNWDLVIARDTGPGYAPEGIVTAAPLKLEKGQPHVEQMTIDLREEGGVCQFILSWGAYRLSTQFSKKGS